MFSKDPITLHDYSNDKHTITITALIASTSVTTWHTSLCRDNDNRYHVQ